MRIILAIPTFNRHGLLAVTAPTVNELADEDTAIHVYDDCSELTREELATLYPTASITKRAENLGADENIRRTMADFLKTEGEILWFVDSDLVASEKAVRVAREVFPATDGVLSLYNSFRHKTVDEATLGATEVVEKETLGNAGVMLAREAVKEILRNVPSSRTFDWDYCQFLRQAGKRLLATRSSYLQHVGFEGTNCTAASATCADLGRNFESDRPDYHVLLYRELEAFLIQTHAQTESYHRRYEEKLNRPLIRHCLSVLGRRWRNTWRVLQGPFNKTQTDGLDKVRADAAS